MKRDTTRFVGRVMRALVGMALVSATAVGCGGGGANLSGAVQSGKWGGAEDNSGSSLFPATLQLTASSGQLTAACLGAAHFDQALILDRTGHFAVVGSCNGLPTSFGGTVHNNVMILTLVDLLGLPNRPIGTYTLILGRDPPAQNGACPP